MDVGELAGKREQVFDALAGGDAAHVEHDRRAIGDAQLLAQDAAARGHRLRIGKAVAAHTHAVRREGADVAGLALRADDDG